MERAFDVSFRERRERVDLRALHRQGEWEPAWGKDLAKDSDRVEDNVPVAEVVEGSRHQDCDLN